MLTIKATQKCRLSIVARDREGNVAAVENPAFAVSDPSVGEIRNVSEDGLSCDFYAGSPTTGQVTFTADGIVGEGENPLTGILDVTVIPGDAAVLEIASGAAEEQE